MPLLLPRHQAPRNSVNTSPVVCLPCCYDNDNDCIRRTGRETWRVVYNKLHLQTGTLIKAFFIYIALKNLPQSCTVIHLIYEIVRENVCNRAKKRKKSRFWI